MKKTLAFIFAGALIGPSAGVLQAKLPPSPPKTDAEKKAEADKAAATKAKDAADLEKATQKAVANYKRNMANKATK
jgi:hypothetical protein